MKKNILPLLAFLALSLVAVSCNEPVDTSGEPKMYAFGFLQSKNQGNLYADYYVDVTDSVIKIEVPDKVDISFLVPSFEMSENDSAYVNGTFRKSGKSAEDFTNPVEFAVRDGSNYAYYTVVVTKAAPLGWSEKAAVKVGVSEMKCTVDDVTGYPAAAVSGTDGCIYYISYDGTSMKAEKVVIDGDEVKGSDVGITFSSKSFPYISFIDGDGDLNVLAKISSWQYAGRKIDAGCRHKGTALGFTSDGKLAVFASDSVTIMDTGGWWKPSGIGGSSFSMKGDYPSVSSEGDILRLALRSPEGGVSLCGFDGGAWSDLADGVRFVGSSGAPSVMAEASFGIDTDTQGNLLLAVNSDCEDAGLRQRVLFYDNVTGVVSQLGGGVTEGYGGAALCDVAVSYINEIYHLYTVRNASGDLYPRLAEFNPAEEAWVDALGLRNEPVTAGDLVANGTGNVYLFTSGKGGEIVLYALE